MELNINGTIYVPKSNSIAEGGYVIARSAQAGVFAGYLMERNGGDVRLTQARRLWYWKGAASLSELSQKGVKYPAECKFPMAVPEVVLIGVCEILPVSQEAMDSIAEVPVWTA